MTSNKKYNFPFFDFIKLMRPWQWTKNTVVFAAFIFAMWDKSQGISMQADLLRIIYAVIIFCFVSSSIYIINDIRDVKSDRAHPTKCNRPIASGNISITTGWITAIIMLLSSITAAWILSHNFFTVICIYIIIQLIYSLGLKHLALIDVFVIATGFVLRAVAGAVAINVDISPWLLICTFLLALFLALCKRRHEIISTDGNNTKQRKSLDSYNERLLDQLISICAGATIIFYSIYTLWPDTVNKFGTKALGLTIPFVIFGIFRYLDIAYRYKKGDRPDKVLLTDIPILVTVALYGITVILIFTIS